VIRPPDMSLDKFVVKKRKIEDDDESPAKKKKSQNLTLWKIKKVLWS